MSKATSGAHMEPFSGPDLTRYLMRRHGARLIQQNGSHLVLVLPDGREVWSHDKRVPRLIGRKVAQQLGMTYGGFREDIGHPIISAGRVSRKQGQAKETKPALSATKADALRSVTEMRCALDLLHRAITTGAHGTSFFARIMQDIERAKAALPKVGGA